MWRINVSGKLAVCLCLAVLVMSGCAPKMNMNTVVNEPNFAGVVTDVYENIILVSVNADDDVYRASDCVAVPLDVELNDSMTNFTVGDEVRVYYDGTMDDKYPAQIYTVYAIVLASPANTDDFT